MIYTTYLENGEIVGIYKFTSAISRDGNLQNKLYIEGEYNGNEYYIQNGEPIKKPNKPSENHDFNYTTKTWVLNENKAKDGARNQRNQLLTLVDKVNTIWYSSLSAQQQQELATFRQALLDVPQQAGFPTSIIWPTPPQWLT